MRDGIGQVHYAVTAAARVGQVSTIYRTVARYTISAKQGLKWVGTHGNAVPRPAISGFWRSQASKIAFFLRERTVPDRKDSCIHYQWTSQSEFGQDNGLTRNTGGAPKVKEAHRFFYRGLEIFTLPTILKITLQPLYDKRLLWSRRVQELYTHCSKIPCSEVKRFILVASFLLDFGLVPLGGICRFLCAR